MSAKYISEYQILRTTNLFDYTIFSEKGADGEKCLWILKVIDKIKGLHVEALVPDQWNNNIMPLYTQFNTVNKVTIDALTG